MYIDPFIRAIDNTIARETVLDRKTHILDDILEAPQVRPLCEEIKGLKREKIDIGDCKLYHEQEGNGTPIVIISGGPGCTHHIFHPYFSEASKYARVIYYDQRGVGQSDFDSTGNSYTIKQAIEDLENLRKALKIEKWVLIGHSYGGLLAQCYSLAYPQQVLGLALICTQPATPKVQIEKSRQWDYMTAEEISKIISIHSDKSLTEQRQIYSAHLNGDWKRQCFYKPSNEQLARMARYEWKPAAGFRERICPDIDQIDLQGRFDNFDLPTLIVEATWDLTWGKDKPEKMLKNHPGAKIAIFEKSGHCPFLDEPVKFFALLRDFLKTAQAAPAPAINRVGGGVSWP